MGMSKGSCFRIFSCADGDSASTDELLPPECQASSYKCNWSFRKRLYSHRVPSKNAVLEAESVGCNKICMEAVTNSFNTVNNLYASEQASVQIRPSKEELSVGPALSYSAMNTEDSAIFTQNAINNNENFLESAVIIIQAAIRGNIATWELKKLKNVIKIQAVVRGHLVRVLAVGTLRCILAISKMQAIVRDRFESQLLEKLADIEGKGYHYEGRFYSAKKLLANRFAQQVLTFTRYPRTIRIKCDPLKSDSAWIWLERWMTVVTADTGGKKEQTLSYSDKKDMKSIKLIPNEEKENGLDASKLDHRELELSFESKDVLNSENASNLQAQLDDRLSDSCFNSIGKSEQNQKANDCFSYKYGGNFNMTTKREHSGPLDIEVQKIAMWSRSPKNPSFAVAQSKFKDLSAISKNVKCISSFGSSNEEYGADARIGDKHSQVKKSNGTGFTEKLPSHDFIIQVASSECGTEISVSSTLDSPDRPETECGEIILEIGSMGNHHSSAFTCCNKFLTPANKCNESQRSQSNKLDEAVIYASLLPNSSDSSPVTTSEARSQLGTTAFQPDKSSIEGTPRNRTAAVEPYGTPSSEFPVNTERRRRDCNIVTRSDNKLVSSVTSKTVRRGNSEHLSNELKNENKWGSAVSRNDLDDEPRMSNSNSCSLPSYMQATKSARAKVHASISPKSSPDLHEKDDYTKKRHSLPIGIGKQDSMPCKKRSTPTAQQNPKRNDEHGSHTSAERRWQR